ncbi:MAG: hypothetical protein KDD40_01830 [Bdellovibrionales bacterium]|nr:hypothetical protein [Bdellovibrionales bacterium]
MKSQNEISNFLHNLCFQDSSDLICSWEPLKKYLDSKLYSLSSWTYNFLKTISLPDPQPYDLEYINYLVNLEKYQAITHLLVLQILTQPSVLNKTDIVLWLVEQILDRYNLDLMTQTYLSCNYLQHLNSQGFKNISLDTCEQANKLALSLLSNATIRSKQFSMLEKSQRYHNIASRFEDLLRSLLGRRTFGNIIFQPFSFMFRSQKQSQIGIFSFSPTKEDQKVLREYLRTEVRPLSILETFYSAEKLHELNIEPNCRVIFISAYQSTNCNISEEINVWAEISQSFFRSNDYLGAYTQNINMQTANSEWLEKMQVTKLAHWLWVIESQLSLLNEEVIKRKVRSEMAQKTIFEWLQDNDFTQEDLQDSSKFQKVYFNNSEFKELEKIIIKGILDEV